MEVNANPLTMDFNSVDVSFKMLAAGNYEMLVKKAEVQDVKASTNGGKLLYLELVNIGPATDSQGHPVDPNSTTVFDRINLQPSGKSTWDIVKKSIGQFVQSVPGGIQGATGATVEEAARNFARVAPTAQGKVIKARVDIDKEATRDGRTYPPKNSVAYYIKA